MRQPDLRTVALQVLLLAPFASCKGRYAIDRKSCGTIVDFIAVQADGARQVAKEAYDTLSGGHPANVQEKTEWFLGTVENVQKVTNTMKLISELAFFPGGADSPEWISSRDSLDTQIHCTADHLFEYTGPENLPPPGRAYADTVRNRIVWGVGVGIVDDLKNGGNQANAVVWASEPNAPDQHPSVMILNPTKILQGLNDGSYSASDDLVLSKLRVADKKDIGDGTDWLWFIHWRLYQTILHEFTHTTYAGALADEHYHWKEMMASKSANNAETAATVACLIHIMKSDWDINRFGEIVKPSLDGDVD